MPEPSAVAAADILRRAWRIAVLTGAGISVESGLSTFRGSNGLWEGHDPSDVATPEAFKRDPRFVWRFYNERRGRALSAEPNAGHFALAELARLRETRILTQNVDRVHQRAGSSAVLELHGNLEDVHCCGCGATSSRPGEALPELPRCDHCGAMLRPAVVWFGEALPEGAWEAAVDWVQAAHALLVVGTSALVYPAASLIDIGRTAGAVAIEVNPEATAAHVDLRVGGKATETLPEIVRMLAAPGR